MDWSIQEIARLASTTSCLPGGPSQVLTDMAKAGMSYPSRPLPAVHPPADLTKSPVTLARINLPGTEPAGIFSSLDAAVDGSHPTRTIAPGNGLRICIKAPHGRSAQLEGAAT